MGRPRKTPEVDRGGPIEQLEPLDALELRVAELEQRVAEAGRRALFHSQRGGARVSPAGPMLADIGRALLFDSETPDRVAELLSDPDGEPLEPAAELDAATGGVSGTAEVSTLGNDAA